MAKKKKLTKEYIIWEKAKGRKIEDILDDFPNLTERQRTARINHDKWGTYDTFKGFPPEHPVMKLQKPKFKKFIDKITETGKVIYYKAKTAGSKPVIKKGKTKEYLKQKRAESKALFEKKSQGPDPIMEYIIKPVGKGIKKITKGTTKYIIVPVSKFTGKTSWKGAKKTYQHAIVPSSKYIGKKAWEGTKKGLKGAVEGTEYLIGKTVEAGKEAAGGLIKGAGKATAGILEGTGHAVGGTFKYIGNKIENQAKKSHYEPLKKAGKEIKETGENLEDKIEAAAKKVKRPSKLLKGLGTIAKKTVKEAGDIIDNIDDFFIKKFGFKERYKKTKEPANGKYAVLLIFILLIAAGAIFSISEPSTTSFIIFQQEDTLNYKLLAGTLLLGLTVYLVHKRS